MKKAAYVVKVIEEKDLFEFKKLNKNFKLTVPELRKLSNLILEEYVDEVIKNPDGVELPSSMGMISIKFLNHKIKTVNHKVKQETGIETQFLNFGTNGKTGKIVWEIKKHLSQNKFLKILSFKGHRNFINKAKKTMKERTNYLKTARIPVPDYKRI